MCLVGDDALHAQSDWTRFRGPNGQGISRDQFASEWTPQQFAWRSELSGNGASSPIISQGTVYVTSGSPDGTRVLEAYRLDDGKRLWSYQKSLGDVVLHAKNRLASSTPTTDGELIFAQFSDQQHLIVLACDLGGKLVWERDFGAISVQHGPGSSMIVFENLLIVPMELDSPSQMLALNVRTGKTVWQVDRPVDRATYATPCVLQNGTRKELICPSNAVGVTSLDPLTGQQLWSTSSGFSERVVSSPVLSDGLIFTQCGSGGAGQLLVGIPFRPDLEGATVKPIMTLTKNLPYVVTPLAHEGILYLWCDRGVVRAVDLLAGEELWMGRVGGNFNGSPVMVGEKLYCISEAGELVCVASGRDYKLLGRTELGEAALSTPAIADGKLVVRTETHLIAFDDLK